MAGLFSDLLPEAPARDVRSSSERGIARLADLSPEERAADDEFNRSPSNIAMLDQAIRDERRPAARAELTAERERLMETAGPRMFGGVGKPAGLFTDLLKPVARGQVANQSQAHGDYLDAVGNGFSDLATSARAARWMVGGGDSKDVSQALAKQLARGATAGEQEINDASKSVNDAKGGWETAKAIGGLVWSFVSNPYDAGKMIAQNLPNMVPSMVMGGAGAAAGSAGGPIGMAAGGLGGLAAGSAVVEFGAKLADKVGDALAARKLEPTPENIEAVLNEPGFREAAQQEGLAKGVTIGAIDALSAVVGGKIAMAPFRAASRRVLVREGVNMADSAAVSRALANPEIQAAVKAEVAATPIGRKIAYGGAGVAADSALEGAGEYAGEAAATGQGKLGDAIIEGMTSIGQAGAHVAGAAALERAQGVARVAAERARRDAEVADIGTASTVDEAIGAAVRATAPNQTPEERQAVDFDRLGALGALNAEPTPAAPADTGETIPYDYFTAGQYRPQLPSPDNPSGRSVLINDTDPELTRPERIGDLEAARNYGQAQRERAQSDRDLGITPGTRRAITLDQEGNILEADDVDRRFLSLQRRENRAHAAAAIDAHAIDPALTEATLAAPDVGPKTEKLIFDAIRHGTTDQPAAQAAIARVRGGQPDTAGQGAQPVNPAAPGGQPQAAPAAAGPDGGGEGLNPFQIRGRWARDLPAGQLGLISRNSRNMLERAAALAELDRRNPTRQADRVAHEARRKLWHLIVNAGGVSEKEAADIGIDPRSVKGYRVSGFLRPDGMRADILARALAESGYLTPQQMEDGGDEAARQLVADLLAREFVGREEDRQQYFALLSEHHSASELRESGAEALPSVDLAEVADYDDSGDWSAVEADLETREISEAEAMRLLGFTEKEIADVGARVQQPEGETGQDVARGEEGGGETGVEPNQGKPGGEGGDREGAQEVAVRKPAGEAGQVEKPAAPSKNAQGESAPAQNPEQPAPPPVAESQAPVPSEPGDSGVAPTREVGGPDHVGNANKKVGEAPMASRPQIESNDPLVTAFTELAQRDESFRYGDSSAKSLDAIFAGMRDKEKTADPLTVEDYTDSIDTSEGGTYENVTRAWRLDSPEWQVEGEQFPRFATVLADGKRKEVWIDVSQLQGGNEGSRIYQAVAAWAHNNGYLFIADPAGMSNPAVYRRTEAMISSALRFGTTRHLMPGPRQIAYDPRLKDKVRPLDWQPGNDAHNLRELLLTSYHNTLGLAPELEHVEYDLGSRQFIRTAPAEVDAKADVLADVRPGEGGSDAGRGIVGGTQQGEQPLLGKQPFRDADFVAIGRRILGGRADISDRWEREAAPAAGVSTLKKAALVGSISRRESSESGRPLLDRLAGQWLQQLGQHFDRAFASRSAETGSPDARRDGAQREQPDARREGRDKGVSARERRSVEGVRASLEAAYGVDGIAALERDGILHITTWAGAPHGLTDRLRSGDHGAYWPGRGAWIFADNVPLTDAPRVLLHEIGEHYGLKAMLGDVRYDRLLAQVKTLHKMGDKAIVAAWNHVKGNYNDKEGSERFMREVIAKAGEDARVQSAKWWQRLLDAVRAWALKHGFAKLTGAEDLNILLHASVKAAMREAGGAVAVNADGVMASRTGEPPMASRSDLFDSSIAEPAAPAETKAFLGSMKDGVRPVALGAFTRQQLAEMYGRDMPEVERYDALQADMDAMRSNLAQDADKILQAWRDLPRETADKLADIMHDATLAQFDPDTGTKGQGFGLPVAQQTSLQNRFNGLGEDAKTVYRQAREMYQDRLNRLFSALAARIQRSGADPDATKKTIDQLRELYDGHLRNGPYFPLARFGDYLLIATNKNDEADRMVMSFESARERDRQATMMRAKGYRVKSTVSKEYSRARDGSAGPLAEAMSEAINELDFDTLDLTTADGKNLGDVKGQLLDELNQAFIRGLPELSYRKHFIHRKGTPGFSKDAMRAFADSMLHASNHIAKMEYGDQMARQLDDAQKGIAGESDGDLTVRQQVLNEMVKRHDLAMNHVTHPVAAMLGQVGFVMSLGASVASGVVNLTQTPLVTMPYLGAKFGWDRATAALSRAAKQYATSPWEWESGFNAEKNGALSTEQRAMLAELERRGKINTTMAHDLAGASNTDNLNQFSKYGAGWQRIMRAVGWTFHVPEVANRQITALATYDLAKRAGQSHADAVIAAAEAIDKTHFDYSKANRARYFEGNFRRVLLMFKQYGQNIAFLYGRAAYQALKGATPEEKQEARRLITGLVVTQFAAAGALGLPFIGTAASILTALANGFRDDDDERDWEVEFRKMLANSLGKDAGEAIAHGLPRLALGWDLSGRIGQNDLFIRAPNREQEGRDAYYAWMQALAGPVAGYAANLFLGSGDMLKGVKNLDSGLMMRGAEELLPAAVRNPLKAMRYQAEDVRTRSGQKQIELDAFEKLGQALGFTPTRVAEMYEGMSAVKNAEHRITERRRELLDNYARSVRDKDLSGRSAIMADIREFNGRHPTMAIKADTLQKSVQGRQKREAGARDGLYLPRNREFLRQEGAFANL